MASWREDTAEIQGDSSLSPNGFSGFGIAAISALLQILGILSWHMQVWCLGRSGFAQQPFFTLFQKVGIYQWIE